MSERDTWIHLVAGGEGCSIGDSLHRVKLCLASFFNSISQFMEYSMSAFFKLKAARTADQIMI